MSTPTRHIKEKIPNPNGVKECYVVLYQLIPSVSAIKQEQCPEEKEHFQDNFSEKTSFTKDFQDGHLHKLEVKEEPTVEESSSSETKDLFECSTTRDALDVPITPKPSVSRWILSLNKGQIQQELRKLGLDPPRTIDECRAVLRNYFKSKIRKMEPNVTRSQNRDVSTQQLITDHLPYQCKFCNYLFGTNSSFMDHEQKCKEAFSLSNLLGKRKQTENEDKKHFVCCEKPFTVFQHFNSHKFSEHKIALLVCGLCDKKEVTLLRLFKHYTNDHFPGCNPLKYQYLKKKKWRGPADSLVTESQNHVSTQQLHTDHLPYLCKLCNCVFGIKSSFIHHEKNCKEASNVSTVSQKTEVEDDKLFNCCEKIFSIFQLFNAHKLTVHGIELLACGLCDKEENTPFILYKHYINDHFPGCKTLLEYKSEKKKKKTADPLVTSSRNEEECTAAQEGIMCQCATCDRKKTKDTPVCSRPYVCKICNFRFSMKSQFNKHMMLHNNSKR